MGKRIRMIAWTEDKKWSDRFIPEIKAIVGNYILDIAPADDDRERNTDLIVLGVNAARIACRVRRWNYMPYSDEFTIRTHRPRGTKTELAKIIEGWGDYVFYAISDREENSLACYILGDLRVFRTWFVRKLWENKGVIPGRKKNNTDGSSSFLAFKIDEMPSEFIIARKIAPITEATGSLT